MKHLIDLFPNAIELMQKFPPGFATDGMYYTTPYWALAQDKDKRCVLILTTFSFHFPDPIVVRYPTYNVIGVKVSERTKRIWGTLLWVTYQ